MLPAKWKCELLRRGKGRFRLVLIYDELVSSDSKGPYVEGSGDFGKYIYGDSRIPLFIIAQLNPADGQLARKCLLAQAGTATLFLDFVAEFAHPEHVKILTLYAINVTAVRGKMNRVTVKH